MSGAGMKKTIYLKVSSKTNKVKASIKRDFMPLHKQYYGQMRREHFYPTITIKLNVDIPDKFFNDAQKELDLKITELNIDKEIKVEEEKEVQEK